MSIYKYNPENIFAKILRDEASSIRVYEDDETLSFMDIMPRADGHCLVIPKSPCRNLLDASDAQLVAVMLTVRKMSRAVMKAFDAQGVTVQQFNEAVGGQEVFHFHVHILPRHEGVALRAPGIMADREVLNVQADKIRFALT